MPFVTNSQLLSGDKYDGIMGLAPLDQIDNSSIPFFMNFLYIDYQNIWGGF
jgi:hypothetical protein